MLASNPSVIRGIPIKKSFRLIHPAYPGLEESLALPPSRTDAQVRRALRTAAELLTKTGELVMIIVIVNFPLPPRMSFANYKAKMMETVPRYKGMAGLLRKNYIYDGARHLGGAVYTFESRLHAEACFSEEFVQRVTTAYGAPDIRYFETPILIDNEKNTVIELAASH